MKFPKIRLVRNIGQVHCLTCKVMSAVIQKLYFPVSYKTMAYIAGERGGVIRMLLIVGTPAGITLMARDIMPGSNQ
jgi:hypothetical protein